MAKYLLLILLTLTACARPEESAPPDATLKFLEGLEDPEIQVRGDAPTPLQSPLGELDTSDLFHHIYIMQNLGEQTARTTWAADSQEEMLNFYRVADTHTSTEFKNSPYADFLISNSKSAFLAATENLDAIFSEEITKIFRVIDKAEKSSTPPEGSISVLQALRSITVFLNEFEQQISQSNIMPAFKAAILSGIYEVFWLKLPATEQVLRQFESSANFEQAVSTLRSFIDSYNIELSQDVQGKLASASAIGEMLNQTKPNEKDAFVLLVTIWLEMNRQEQKETFGAMSPELYDFFKSKSERQLRCLKERGCEDLLLSITKKFFILPEIKKYGTDKIIKDIESSAVTALNQQTGQMATDLVIELPQILRSEIASKISQELERFQSYRHDYDGFVRGEVQAWYEKKFARKTLPALEKHRVRLRQLGQHLQFVPIEESHMETSADGLGDALLASYQFFKKPRAKSLSYSIVPAQILSLTRINQMLAHGGFSLANGQSFVSLSRAMSLNKLLPLNIQQMGLTHSTLFTMPARSSVRTGFRLRDDAIPSGFSIRSQAKLLRGFSRMTQVFRDWTKAPMDDLLGNVEAGEILQNIPAEDLAVPAFPKDAFLAIAFGNASSILTNLKAKGSPLFIQCVDGQVIWGDQSQTCEQPSALASLVSIENHKRKSFVSTFEHALFLEALIQYLEMGQDLVQKTKSTYLLSSENGQESPIVSFRRALPEVRNLALAMTNMLVSKLQNTDGRFWTEYDWSKNSTSGNFVNVDEHMKILNALIYSAEYFQIPPYRRAVVRAYVALNQNHFDHEVQFYVNPRSHEPINTIRMAQALHTLPQILPMLSNTRSEAQLRELIQLWQNSLRGRKL